MISTSLGLPARAGEVKIRPRASELRGFKVSTRAQRSLLTRAMASSEAPESLKYVLYINMRQHVLDGAPAQLEVLISLAP